MDPISARLRARPTRKTLALTPASNNMETAKATAKSRSNFSAMLRCSALVNSSTASAWRSSSW